MNATVVMVVRIIFGLALLFFGANKLFHFMDPPPPPTEEAMNYWAALMGSQTMNLVAIVEVLAGLALLLNKFAPLMMLILMSISINAVLYHATLDPGSIVMALVLLVLNIFMLYVYRDRYKDILSS